MTDTLDDAALAKLEAMAQVGILLEPQYVLALIAELRRRRVEVEALRDTLAQVRAWIGDKQYPALHAILDAARKREETR